MIVESNHCNRAFLARAIELNRPKHKIYVAENLEQVFSLIYSEIKLDIIFFDFEPQVETNNLALIQTISPNTTLIHWSRCQHPEIIELLHEMGINSFCLKDSAPRTIVEAIDLAQTNPKILYIDERLGKCLPLLTS
ncbi:MAG TPA: DNA-binding response regulator [Xenococcaceae cyanobacterium]